MITIEIRFNRITIRHNDIVAEHCGTFSNSRMIIADSFQWRSELIAAINKAADEGIFKRKSWVMPKLARFATDNRQNSPICVLTCAKHWKTAYLTLEWNILLNTLAWINPKNIMKQLETLILYQGKQPACMLTFKQAKQQSKTIEQLEKACLGSQASLRNFSSSLKLILITAKQP
ncbi:hypothetical protein A7P98_07160 [Eikenella sp. NML080894]|uniref:hypothetical protein n=1 Tax=Eikenella TaxID=538 RepID=UPI0007E0D420|nr:MULTISPECIES: hypothetical protein [Eikenella]OAM35646.1 hypothetical protein A7P98_07160 [Eikenella sp. NML080894]OAM37926.1 hypothetical protein A7P99_06015 [Eikenella sp. NML120348]OAM45661.1 hypothetical protein A7Q03_04510 [Eikenella sp. NML99-0057]